MGNKAPFCLNSRVWLDFLLFWHVSSCPYTEQACEDCGYYEIRPITAYYRRKAKALKEQK